MKKMKRFIDVAIPVQTCNLRCKYCYIAQTNKFLEALPYFMYDAKTIGKALSKERLGGICHLNLCGGGETLLPPQMTEIISELLKQGHYIAIVTNGTITKRFEELCQLPEEYRKRLLFKFSFHYLELERLGWFEKFWNNVHMVQKAGCSFSVELTPNDETIPYIEDIKKMCLKEVKALCHITVARNEQDPKLPILTEHTKEEYYKIWDTFDSELFRFKMTTFNVKRKEFCYAGLWTGVLNLGTGILRQCYCGKIIQNIFKDTDKPIKWNAIGCHCTEPHCHNSHVWLTLGNIPEIETPTYALMRNRVCTDGTEWLNKEMKSFLSSKLEDSNNKYTPSEKKKINIKMAIPSFFATIYLGLFNFIRLHTPKKIRRMIIKKIKKY
ncbi:MAG: radical SAM domain-containing protein [bacterium F083]|nr:MAG: radical SAM domain-containing protein [bacterium F083]